MARYLRLGMTQRFVLLVVLCGIAILVPALAYSWQAWNSARSHGLEREGLAPARALLRVVQLTQQHRGLSAVWLGGDESQAGARKARADDVGSALAAFESELGRKGVDAGSALARHWRDSRAAWEALQAEVSRKGLDGGASSARHAVVIAGFLRGLDLVLDHWGLVFDPVAADYYLIVAALQGAPRAIETLGQMRARGANLLSNPDKATPEARAAYSTLANTLEAQVASVGFGLERAAAHGAAATCSGRWPGWSAACATTPGRWPWPAARSPRATRTCRRAPSRRPAPCSRRRRRWSSCASPSAQRRQRAPGQPAGQPGQRGGRPRRCTRRRPGRHDGAHPGELAAHRRDHRHHRRHRLPDQHPGAQCRGGGGPRRRAGPRLRGRGLPRCARWRSAAPRRRARSAP
jgi:hypothetical protein